MVWYNFASFQVALYKYVGTEWEKTNIEGTLFVYTRKCEPCFGFLILNRLSATNLIQPITKDIELQDKTPFLLYKTEVSDTDDGQLVCLNHLLLQDIHGIWFYEQTNCKKLFQIINDVIEKLKGHGSNQGLRQIKQPMAPGPSTKNGEISLADLLTNAGNKVQQQQQQQTLKISPSGGEKLLRLLSSSANNDEHEIQEVKANGDTVAAFFAQASQGNTSGKS